MLTKVKNAEGLFIRMRAPIDTGKLASLESAQIAAIFRSRQIEQQWNAWTVRLADLCRIEDLKTGGVNPGDRRALFYVVKALRPASILEIGSHVGASTVYVGAAM